MLYTTYISKLSKLPPDDHKIIITRYLPRGFKIEKYPNTYHYPQLSPSDELLKKYKDGCSWNEFSKEFYKEIENRPDLSRTINSLVEFYNKHKRTMYLLCYEKDQYSCHRHLLSLYLKEKHNISCEEVIFE